MITISTQNGDILANISGKDTVQVQKLAERIRKAYSKASPYIPNNPNISTDNRTIRCGQNVRFCKNGAIMITA